MVLKGILFFITIQHYMSRVSNLHCGNSGFSECEEVGIIGMTPCGLHKALSHGCLVVVKLSTIGPHQLCLRVEKRLFLFISTPTYQNGFMTFQHRQMTVKSSKKLENKVPKSITIVFQEVTSLPTIPRRQT